MFVKVLLVLPCLLCVCAAAPTTGTVQNQPEVCKQFGYQCLNCSASIFCDKQNDKWSIIETLRCPNNTCDNGECKDVPSRECLDKNKVPSCRSSEGMFPNPGSCREFYYCTPSDSGKLNLVRSNCTGGYSYNPLTTYCDKPLPADDVCKGYPVPNCTTPGLTGALTENPSIYFTCLPVVSNGIRVFYPYLDACPNGKKYQAANRTCSTT
ncbi:hypothetical protein PPYR_13021 [Photinus pyralis]|uniref:Chitin-binding type-2 domain-containing protein n=2 Tax=Photinus pyralis TaxID=7054 RepID=A0A5N4A7U8_PHOPY|nr:uncharacterized protein LOC116177696 [Photinus pyralis]KAB0793401.1 hypothetical protein PPYR_13021 [Photinus pyralis]